MGKRTASLVLVLLVCWSALASPQPPVGKIGDIPFYRDSVHTKDGVQLALAELAGNDDADVVLILPGLVETHATFDGLAQYLHRRGFKVFVSHNRLVGDHVLRSNGADENQNGLLEIFRFDTPAIVEHVIHRNALREAFLNKKSKVHVIGHSMGGIQLMALLSDPVFGPRLGPQIESVSLLTAPHHLRYLPLWIRAIARVLLPLVDAVQALGFQEFDLHHRVFLPLQKYGAHPNQVIQKAARAIEFFTASAISKIFVNRIIVDPRNAQANEIRRLIRKEISVIPLKTLADFGRWALSKIPPVEIDLAKISNRTLIFSAELDRLAPPAEQRELFAELANAAQARHMIAMQTHHVDITIGQKLEELIYPELVEFMLNPQAFSQRSTWVIDPTICGRSL